MPPRSSINPSPSTEELIQRVLNHEGSMDDTAALNQILPDDPAARAYFVKLSRIHHAMEDVFSAADPQGIADLLQGVEEPAKAVPFPHPLPGHAKPSSFKPPGSRTTRWLAWAAALALIAGISGTLWHRQLQKNTAFQIVSAQNTGNDSSNRGLRLRDGDKLNLPTGNAELKSPDGNSLWLQGPGCLHIHNRNRVTLEQGRLWCQLDGPHLSIQTPEAIVQDIGTSFGMQRNVDGSLRVDVLNGMVEAVDPQDRTRRIGAGAGYQLSITRSKWPDKPEKADFSIYGSSPMRPVGIVLVPNPQAAEQFRDQFILDTRWVPVTGGAGRKKGGNHEFTVCWTAGSIHNGITPGSAEDTTFSSHWLGTKWNRSDVDRATKYGVPMTNDGIVIQFEQMRQWLQSIGAKSYRVEIHRSSTNRNNQFLPVRALRGGPLLRDAVLSQDAEPVDFSKFPNIHDVGTRQISRFAEPFDSDVLTLTVPVHEKGPENKISCISAVRLIPEL